ncbi:hypothetical protein SAMN04488505_10945 [Chitinophaga rupis]|uniref:Uncharacterized protein n=1 Tax=Chitinophaga rupis TaxID=573321 RepID=A0A1H8EV99_9BACT|nr:hypothetical protein [Chitinophaga rupis]SEN23551.1 hypothetical protein SAMN04488505_10945 [Chitinophaga rupis]
MYDISVTRAIIPFTDPQFLVYTGNFLLTTFIHWALNHRIAIPYSQFPIKEQQIAVVVLHSRSLEPQFAVSLLPEQILYLCFWLRSRSCDGSSRKTLPQIINDALSTLHASISCPLGRVIKYQRGTVTLVTGNYHGIINSFHQAF